MATSFSTVFPMKVGEVIKDVVAGWNDAQVAAFHKHWNKTVKSMFDAFVAAGIDPILAAEIALKSYKPGEVKDLVLEYQGNATTIASRGENQEFGFSLGFQAATVNVGAAFDRSVEKNTAESSSGAGYLRIQVGPASDEDFTRALLEALQQSGASKLPELPPLV